MLIKFQRWSWLKGQQTKTLNVPVLGNGYPSKVAWRELVDMLKGFKGKVEVEE